MQILKLFKKIIFRQTLAAICVFYSSNQVSDDHDADDHDDDDDDDDDHDDHDDDDHDDSQAGCDEPPRAAGPKTSAEASTGNRNLPGLVDLLYRTQVYLGSDLCVRVSLTH